MEESFGLELVALKSVATFGEYGLNIYVVYCRNKEIGCDLSYKRTDGRRFIIHFMI